MSSERDDERDQVDGDKAESDRAESDRAESDRADGDQADGDQAERDPRPTPAAPILERPTLAADESLGSASRANAPRASLMVMLRAGIRSLIRYPGLVAALYLVQLALSAGAGLIMLTVLTRVFGTRPMFDRAMDGDLAALFTCLGDPGGAQAMFGLIVVGLGAAFLYGTISWFLTAGLIAVFLDAPSRGREVARWFGAGAAANFFAFVRLSLWSVLPLLVVAVAGVSGLWWIDQHMGGAMDGLATAEVFAIGLGPAMLVHWVLAAAIDYARIDLVRHPGLSALRALARGFGLVFRRPHALVHTLLYGIVFAGATAVAVWAGLGAGVAGLGALVAVRQAVSLTRFVAHVGLIAGQVELACTTLPAPLARSR